MEYKTKDEIVRELKRDYKGRVYEVNTEVLNPGYNRKRVPLLPGTPAMSVFMI